MELQKEVAQRGAFRIWCSENFVDVLKSFEVKGNVASALSWFAFLSIYA